MSPTLAVQCGCVRILYAYNMVRLHTSFTRAPPYTQHTGPHAILRPVLSVLGKVLRPRVTNKISSTQIDSQVGAMTRRSLETKTMVHKSDGQWEER